MKMVEQGTAMCVPGNHDMKLMRKLKGRDVQITHGMAESIAQLAGEPPEFTKEVAKFIDDLVSHYVFDGGNLVVAHAGMKEEMQGRGSGKVREFALFGETTGETDEYGLPVRYNWAAEYRGKAMVVYGHTPVVEPEWLNRTINVDTGCVFGGKLTAFRYPKRNWFQYRRNEFITNLPSPFCRRKCCRYRQNSRPSKYTTTCLRSRTSLENVWSKPACGETLPSGKRMPSRPWRS